MRLTFLVNLIVLIQLISCVGTIEKSKDLNETTIVPDGYITFAGLTRGEAWSHEKVALYFRPASSGSGSYSYLIYKDGDNIPFLSVDGDSAIIEEDGTIRAVVSGLLKGVNYSFKAIAKDNVTNFYGNNDSLITIRTLTKENPLFNGIYSVTNLAGIDGQSKIMLNWQKAATSELNPNPFVTSPLSISGYNIYIGESYNNLTFLTSIVGANTISYTVTGLDDGKTYYFMVRSKDSQTTEAPREDQNTKVLKLRTTSAGSIQFNGLGSLALTKTPNANAGYSSIDLSWTAGTGTYDRYRVFLSTIPVAGFDPATDAQYGLDITNLALTKQSISVATPNQIYYIALVACNNVACTDFKGEDRVLTIRTSPPVAPFNGISSITSPPGVDQLTQLILNLDAPDTTAGVYDQIRIFRTNAQGQYNPATDRVPDYNLGTPAVTGVDITESTNTRFVIKGLVTNQEYCFVAKAYSTSPVDPENPTGRTHLNEKKMCATPFLTMPGFVGITPICTNITPTSFDISWNIPDPLGTYQFYELYYKKNEVAPFSFTNALTFLNYTIVSIPQGDVSRTISSLDPGTTYKLGMKTYFQHPLTSVVYRDSNQVVLTCSTTPVKANHNGWLGLMALGPKIHGITKTVLKERLTPTTPGDYIDGVWRHPYPQEYLLGTNGVNASEQGIVRLEWNDFNLSGGVGNIFDFASLTTGYNVYRKTYHVAHESNAPTAVGDTSVGVWTKVNTDVIQPASRLYRGVATIMGEFNDYTVDRTGLASNETKIYWYKVVPVLNSVNIDFETNPPDGVIKVVLPPNNMAFVHRWIANQEICDRLQRPIDRANNYRCAYTGLASTNGFYDIGKHTLVDRFELGRTFTRGNDALGGCTNISAVTFEGDGNNGTLVGDCVGREDPNTKVSAHQGAIFLNRANLYSYYNYNGTTGWYEIYNIVTPGVWAAATKESFSSTLVPYDAVNFPLGQGIGGKWTSNDAQLPYLNRIRPWAMTQICANFDVRYKGQDLKKRAPKVKELAAMIGEHPLMNPSQVITWENGGTQAGLVLTRDCGSIPTDSALFTGLLIIDLLHPTSIASVNTARLKTGSAGVKSSEACVSRFGVQDLVGGIGEWLFDEFSCDLNWGCSPVYSDAASTTVFNPYSGDDSYRDDWFNYADSSYFVQRISSPSFGHPAATGGVYVTSLAKYFAPAMMMPLSCDPPYCSNGGDDNIRITSQAAAPGASILNYPLDMVSYTALGPRAASVGPERHWFLTSDLGASWRSSKTYLEIASEATSANSGGRCAVAIGD